MADTVICTLNTFRQKFSRLFPPRQRHKLNEVEEEMNIFIGILLVRQKWADIGPVMGEILYNVIYYQNQNHHTKKDLKSKSKSCFKMYFKSKYNHRDFTNPKSFSLTPSSSGCCLNVLHKYTDCLILMHKYI